MSPVELHEVDDGCLIRVTDDGAGYNFADVEGRTCPLGLMLMQELAVLTGEGAASKAVRAPAPLSSSGVPLGESSTVHGAAPRRRW